MEKFKVSFVANNQQLTATGTKHASDTYADIEATFALGERWTDMDSVSAVWWNDFTRIATVLDSEGKCTVPYEVLTRKGCVRVNLVGSVVEDGELVTRLTSYSAEAVHVNEKIKLTGNEPQTITPSQYEQFVENVKADADRAESAKESAETASASAQGYAQSASASATSASESATASEQSATASARDAQTVSEIAVEVEVMKNEAELARDEILGMRAEAVTLPAGSEATASYADGLLSLGIPRGNTGATGAKGDKGDTGATPNLTIGDVETLEPTESATATITGTAENPVLNLGIPQGDTGEVSLADLSTLLPTDTASGDIASFTDGQSVIPLLSLLADIEPIQSGSGTPSPDNVRPISGHTDVVTHRTGVNVWDEEWEEGTINTNGDNSSSTTRWRTKNYISIKPNTQYYFKGTKTGSGTASIRPRFYDANKVYIGNTSQSGTDIVVNTVFTTPTNAYYMRFTPDKSGTYGILTDEVSINYPSTDHEYHAYNGNTYTTNLGRTVYGGTLDVVSGVLTIDRALIDGSNLTFAYWDWDKFYSNAVSGKTASAGKVGISEVYQIQSNYGNDFQKQRFYIEDTSANHDASVVNANVQGKKFVYYLATPQTIQLTPQEVYALLGQNNVWADCGSVEVTYKADVGLYIDKKLN